MNKLAVAIALVAVAAAGPVLADGAEREQPFTPVATTLDRGTVQAEALAARTAGLTVVGEREAVAAPVSVASLTRAQVMAEAAEAARLGLSVVGERQPQATPDQLRQIRQAGLRAVGATVAGLAR